MLVPLLRLVPERLEDQLGRVPAIVCFVLDRRLAGQAEGLELRYELFIRPEAGDEPVPYLGLLLGQALVPQAILGKIFVSKDQLTEVLYLKRRRRLGPGRVADRRQPAAPLPLFFS